MMPYALQKSKYRLTTAPDGSQNPAVAAKSATGICTPSNPTATPDAFSVFFIVAASAHLHSAALFRIESMVSLAGHSKEWPVFVGAGSANPVRVTANYEICTSGGGMFCYPTETAIMATISTHPHPQFTWIFLAVRRSDLLAKPQRKEVTAPDFITARRVLARDFVASFAGRMPVREVPYV